MLLGKTLMKKCCGKKNSAKFQPGIFKLKAFIWKEKKIEYKFSYWPSYSSKINILFVLR